MLSRLREHLGTAGLIVAIVALVAALGGGAYAASGGLTGKQKKEVEKIAKKYGKPGAPGAAGPAGPAGAVGKDSAPGANGTNGANGGSVTSTPIAAGGACGAGVTGTKYTVGGSSTNVCNGKNGTTGFTETLPEGKTETGIWGSTVTQKKTTYDVSFPIPLASPPTAVIVKPTEMNNGAGAAEGCPWEGTGTPTADPGKFCAYLAIEETVANLNLVQATHPHWEEFLGEYVGEPVGGAATYGVTLTASCVGSAEAVCNAYGAWAVTAE